METATATDNTVNTDRSSDIASLLEVGVPLEKLEELYGRQPVHAIAQARLAEVLQQEDDDVKEDHKKQRQSLARLLFLRSKTTALKSILDDSTVMDAVLRSLVADPEDALLMDPLMLTPLKDPVVISSGFVMDRTTALDADKRLRMHHCPFTRVPLQPNVFPCIPIRNKVKEWEHSRLQQCLEVATKMIDSQDYARAEQVFEIGYALLQELGETTYLHIAKKLALLQCQLPLIENDTKAMIQIHVRLLRTAANKDETKTLLQAIITECHNKVQTLLWANVISECNDIRSAYDAAILTPSTLNEYRLELFDPLLKLYRLDLAVAKKSGDPQHLWKKRRKIIQLLNANKPTTNTEQGDSNLSTFLREEGLTGTEPELEDYPEYDSSLDWPQDQLINPQLGLVHFRCRNGAIGFLNGQRDLSPIPNAENNEPGDHWVEVAFRASRTRYPSYRNSIFSQHGHGNGWEIRVGENDRDGIINYVEAVWTTTPGHNAFFNYHVPIQVGQWYHVILAYRCDQQKLTLYVNGAPHHKTIEGTFVPCPLRPHIGDNPQWRDRYFEGMVAFAWACTEFPIPHEEVENRVKALSEARLEQLQACPEAMVPLYDESLVSSSGDRGDYLGGW